MYVKVCGITHIDDARAAIAAGADALGFNCVPGSKRELGADAIRGLVEQLRQEVPGRTLYVAVVADLEPAAAQALLERLGVDRLQLHGDEPPAALAALGGRAFKALRIGDAADVSRAASYPGHPLLVDAKVPGQLGGTGHTLDWSLVEPLARARCLMLAGGLTPENVAQAVRVVQPWGVDTASGVETSEPRRKDPDKLQRFVAAARAAASRTLTRPF